VGGGRSVALGHYERGGGEKVKKAWGAVGSGGREIRVQGRAILSLYENAFLMH